MFTRVFSVATPEFWWLLLLWGRTWEGAKITENYWFCLFGDRIGSHIAPCIREDIQVSPQCISSVLCLFLFVCVCALIFTTLWRRVSVCVSHLHCGDMIPYGDIIQYSIRKKPRNSVWECSNLICIYPMSPGGSISHTKATLTLQSLKKWDCCTRNT